MFYNIFLVFLMILEVSWSYFVVLLLLCALTSFFLPVFWLTSSIPSYGRLPSNNPWPSSVCIYFKCKALKDLLKAVCKVGRDWEKRWLTGGLHCTVILQGVDSFMERVPRASPCRSFLWGCSVFPSQKSYCSASGSIWLLVSCIQTRRVSEGQASPWAFNFNYEFSQLVLR